MVIKLFCHRIKVNKPERLHIKGPLLIASNHPDSFLDAIIYDILFDVPVWSLARGDAFKAGWAASILKRLKILPVYRLREGVENLQGNYQTFDDCLSIFKNKEAVLIFSEGLCINEWHLRPLRKGTARLAFSAWEQNIPLQVLPCAINYSSFRRYGKLVHVNIGETIVSGAFKMSDSDGLRNAQFNKILEAALKQGVYEISNTDAAKLDACFHLSEIRQKGRWLWPLAMAGMVLHAPLFGTAAYLSRRFAADNDHYDSILFGILLLSYPLYLILLAVPGYYFSGTACAIILTLLLPITARCFVLYKVRADRSFGGI